MGYIRTHFTERQRYALGHPVDRTSGRVVPNPTYASRRDGRWSSVLIVAKMPCHPWLWEASVARYGDDGRPMQVRLWHPQWRDEAEGLLAVLLAGVGGPTFDIRGHIQRSGVDPGRLVAHHKAVELTAREVVFVCGGAAQWT